MAKETPVDNVLDRIRESLAGWLPPERVAEMNDRVTRAVTASLERFQLVPKEEFERQVTLVAKLLIEVDRLDARVAILESELAAD